VHAREELVLQGATSRTGVDELHSCRRDRDATREDEVDEERGSGSVRKERSPTERAALLVERKEKECLGCGEYARVHRETLARGSERHVNMR